MRNFGRIIFESAFGKSFGLGALGLLGNVFAGGYVFEITKVNSHGEQFLDWRATPFSPSFWMLILVAFALGLYALGIARYERRIRRALTDAEVRQRALEVLLEPTLQAIKKEVEGGKLWSIEEVVKLLPTERQRK